MKMIGWTRIIASLVEELLLATPHDTVYLMVIKRYNVEGVARNKVLYVNIRITWSGMLHLSSQHYVTL
jgi:hypothetical protein